MSNKTTVLYEDYTQDAAELMRKADAGDAEAQYTFATYLLREADFSYRKDLADDEVQRGLRYLQLAAAQGHFHGIAADDLGMIYYEGEIVPQDYDKAKMWFNTAKLKGIPTADFMLGECAYYGHGEAVDYKKAAKHYLQAASTYINALYRLGDMYLRGAYFPCDPMFAKELYDCVLLHEEQLHKKHGFYSNAYDEARSRLDNMEHTPLEMPHINAKETQEQLKARKKLVKIINKKEKWWS
jgi:TPR repeat protein